MSTPSVEISAWDRIRGRKVHTLGYGFGLEAPHIRALCAPLPKALPGSRFITEEQADVEGWTGDAMPAGMVWILDTARGAVDRVTLRRRIQGWHPAAQLTLTGKVVSK